MIQSYREGWCSLIASVVGRLLWLSDCLIAWLQIRGAAEYKALGAAWRESLLADVEDAQCTLLSVTQLAPDEVRDRDDFSRTSIYDKFSGPVKITAHLDDISHSKAKSGTHWLNGWTYRVLSMQIRPD